MKSEYRKQKENRAILGLYAIIMIVLVSTFIIAGKVQQNCLESNNITLCD